MKTILQLAGSEAYRGIVLYFPIIAIYSDSSLLRLLVRGYCHTPVVIIRTKFVRLVNNM